jgi:uncharacterized protein (TIGR03663 family)
VPALADPEPPALAQAERFSADGETKTASAQSWAARLRTTRQISVEALLFSLIAVLAVVSRFWDLTSRAQHHDESLHTYFSWLYYAGEGYTHDPLMHGPFLFHANALAYLLFGDNDYVSRIVPATLGVLIVLMPWLLRSPRLLGRWGALCCSVFFLLSPTILYYSRFIREDIHTAFGILALVVCLARYLDEQERRWLIGMGLSTAYLFTTKEVSFIAGFIIVTFLGIVVAWQVSRALLGILAGTAVALAGVVFGLRGLGVSPLPGIPWENPTSANIQQFALDLVQHPIILACLGVVGLGIVAALMVLDRLRDPDGGGWLNDILGRQPENTTAHVVYRALRDRRGLMLAFVGGAVIFVTLYTSLFTNMAGLGSATFGALGYWLGQHDVQRGEQPWFYYLLMLPQYEFVATLIFPFAAVLITWRVVKRLRAGLDVGRRLYFQAFLLYWSVMMLAILSWAGEKMPWLTFHIAMPMIMLAASVVGEGIERVEARATARTLPRRSAAIVAAGVPLVCVAWFLLWAWGTAGPWEEVNGQLIRTLRPVVADNVWLLYLPLVALGALVVLGVQRLGWRVAGAVTGLSLVGVLLVAQLHVAWRLSFEEGDVPKDMLIYVQSSPDVTRVVEELGLFSRELTGGLDMRVDYDSGTSWPMQWYLRDYTNRRFFGSELTSPPDAPIVLISRDSLSQHPENETMLSGYTYQEYAMRWWFPEEATYRRFAIAPELNNLSRQNYQNDKQAPYSLTDVLGSVWSSLWSMREPEQQAKMFRLVAYRELWAPIGSYNFRVYVRNDLLPVFNEMRYS